MPGPVSVRGMPFLSTFGSGRCFIIGDWASLSGACAQAERMKKQSKVIDSFLRKSGMRGFYMGEGAMSTGLRPPLPLWERAGEMVIFS